MLCSQISDEFKLQKHDLDISVIIQSALEVFKGAQ